MNKLINIKTASDIPLEYRDTPIEKLLKYHNLNEKFQDYSNAQLLVGMCMDNRVQLRLPKKFAFVMRDGGANFQNSEFKIAYALSVARLKYFAIIGHTDCGMSGLEKRKKPFISGLEEAGWERGDAEEYFIREAPNSEIHDPIRFTFNEAERLSKRFPHIVIAPMIYKVEGDLLYLFK